MSTTAKAAKSVKRAYVSGPATPKVNIYDRITNLIVEQLEKGVIPWQKPWKTLLDGTADVPRNYVTKKAYRGINTILLSCNDDQRPYYLTYKQATALGGQVRKGAKGQMILFYKISKKEDIVTGKDKTSYYEQVSHVFNVADIDGIDFILPSTQALEPTQESVKLAICEAVIKGYPNPPIQVFKNPEKACYYPSLDTVNMPRLEAFRSVEEYYKVYFHELAHSTGHADRLNREELVSGHRMGSKGYAREELIAEMTSNFLACYCNLEMSPQTAMFQNTASYIKGYLTALQDDKMLFYVAARQAQKATDWILGVSHQSQSEEA